MNQNNGVELDKRKEEVQDREANVSIGEGVWLTSP